MLENLCKKAYKLNIFGCFVIILLLDNDNELKLYKLKIFILNFVSFWKFDGQRLFITNNVWHQSICSIFKNIRLNSTTNIIKWTSPTLNPVWMSHIWSHCRSTYSTHPCTTALNNFNILNPYYFSCFDLFGTCHNLHFSITPS